MNFKDLKLVDQFSGVVYQDDLLVGLNDYQVAPKDKHIYEAGYDKGCIIGYVDMGAKHAVFKYDQDHAGLIAQTVADLKAEEAKSVTFTLPEGYLKKHKAWFNYMEEMLVNKGIEVKHQVHSSVLLFNSVAMENPSNANKPKLLVKF